MSKPKKRSSKKSAAKSRNRRSTSSTSSRGRRSSGSMYPDEPILFGKQQYILMGAGTGLVAIGLLLMSGGSMPSPEVWDPDIIYSFRRITLAPIVIIAGFLTIVYGLFKR